MESIDIVRKQVAESERVKAELSKNEEVIAAIAKAADVCTEAYRRGNKTMFAGNGGSAADAQHLVGEFGESIIPVDACRSLSIRM